MFAKRLLSHLLLVPVFFTYFVSCFAMDVPIYNFPIGYSQNANDYFSPNSENYDKNLLSPEYQNAQLKLFYKHYYSSDAQGLSPWSAGLVTTVLPLVKTAEQEMLEEFNNQNKPNEKIHYAENFKAHSQTWWRKIKNNMDLMTIASSQYSDENRAISIANTYARALPASAPDFFYASLPGQGFPFDNLQESAIWAGTPLYVISVSQDKAWSLVLTPDGYFAWVKSNDIAYASAEFISRWQAAAQRSLVAVTKTEASIVDDQQQFQFTGFIGSVFPMIERTDEQTFILIPVKNNANHASIKTTIIDSRASSIMPLAATPKNFIKILNQLKNRPYGWGGAFFFNDCSQEIKSIFTPFGLWLPRNSSKQAQLSSTLDLSKSSVEDRIRLLKEKGHPFMTLIYIGGHIMLYLGNKDIDNHMAAAMTYQNIWGLAPASRDKRYVIGQSLFFPLLKSYPENPDAVSLAAKANFKLVFLDRLDVTADPPRSFIDSFLVTKRPVKYH